MRIIYLAAFIIFTIFCVIVGISNRTIISFSLQPLPLVWDMPLYYLLFAGIFIGLAAGSMVVIGKSIRQAAETRKQVRKIRDLERQIQELKPPETTQAPDPDNEKNS